MALGGDVVDRGADTHDRGVVERPRLDAKGGLVVLRAEPVGA
jgi:hypothetical protein